MAPKEKESGLSVRAWIELSVARINTILSTCSRTSWALTYVCCWSTQLNKPSLAMFEEEYSHMDHSGETPTIVGSDGAPPLVPRGRKPPPPPPDDDLAAGIGAITTEQLYVTDEIKHQPWFVGTVTREETEKLLKTGKRAGNFLVREKTKNKVFVHSYLSLTRMIIVHNLIEFKSDGSCLVDSKPWAHHNKPSLEEVIDRMQQIRQNRKGTKANGDPATYRALIAVWENICPEGLKLPAVRRKVKIMKQMSFMLVMHHGAGPGGYVCLVNVGKGNVHPAQICKSSQGYYLKYSELSANTIQELVCIMLSNPAAAATTGCPKMRIPSDDELSIPIPPAAQPSAKNTASPPLPSRAKAPAAVPISMDDIYDDGDDGDIYEDAEFAYEDVESELPQLPSRPAAVIAQEEDIYDD